MTRDYKTVTETETKTVTVRINDNWFSLHFSANLG